MCPPHLRAVRQIACTTTLTELNGPDALYHPLALDVADVNPLAFPFISLASTAAFVMEEPKFGFHNIFEELGIDGVNPIGRMNPDIQERYKDSVISAITEEEVLTTCETQLPLLRAAAAKTIAQMRADGIHTLADMGVTSEAFTVEGVVPLQDGKTAGLPDRRTLGDFLNDAATELVELPDGRRAIEVDFIADEFCLPDETSRPEFEAVLKYAHHFTEQPGVKEGLRELLISQFAAIFLLAEREIELDIDTDVQVGKCPKCDAKNLAKAWLASGATTSTPSAPVPDDLEAFERG